MQSIASYLARFSAEVRLLNGISDFGINTHAENMLVPLLNHVYGLNLTNVNTTGHNNTPAIDLLDETPGKEIAFQVTSTSSMQKVTDCIKKFFAHDHYLRIRRLKVFIITSKTGSFSQRTINQLIQGEIARLVSEGKVNKAADIKFLFNVEEDIMDGLSLLKHLDKESNPEKIQATEAFLRSQFVLADERNHLDAYYAGLNTMFYDVVMDDKEGMTLNQVYVEPSFAVIRSALAKDHPKLSEGGDLKFFPVNPKYRLEEFIGDILSGENPLKLDVRRGLVLILGYPGQGKSSFCKKLINSYIRQEKTNKKPLFYLQLRNIMQAKEFIFNTADVLHKEACDLTGRNLDRHEFFKSFLVLDGLDELYMRDNLKTEDIDKLCIELTRLLDKFPELQIVLTSRYGYIDDEKLARSNINIVQLMPFSLEQQKQWLAGYQKFHPDSWLREKELNTFHEERKYEHIRELIGQPLLLHMMASVRHKIDERATRSKIYQQLFTELIERNYGGGRLEVFRNITPDQLRKLIREIAFAIFKTGNEYITKTELLKQKEIQHFLKLLPEESFRDSIKSVMISFYFRETGKSKQDDFVEDRSNYGIEFLHKSLREYMTAEKIFYTLKEQFLKKDTEGDFIIDDAKTALQIINEVFGPQDLSPEIISYISDFIRGAGGFDKEALVDRLLRFLPDYLENDFMVEYRMDKDRRPMDISLRCFYGLWYLVSELGLNINYLHTQEVKKRVANYLRWLKEVKHLSFNNQILAAQEIENVAFRFCRFVNTDFSMCSFIYVSFESCELTGGNFNATTISGLEFSNMDLLECSFNQAYIGAVAFLECHLMNTDFISTEIHSFNFFRTPRSEIRNCSFENAFFTQGALNQVKEVYPAVAGQTIETRHMLESFYVPPAKEEIHIVPDSDKWFL